MFDLVLPSLPYIFSLSDDLVEWYSIVFTKASQTVQTNEGQTLIIDVLNLNVDDISFNGNVYVKNLIITKTDASFDVLNFGSINYDSVGCNVKLFTIQSTSTDLESFNLVKNETTGAIYATVCNIAHESYFATLLSILGIILIII